MKKTSAVACVSMLLMSCSGSEAATSPTSEATPATSTAPTTAASTSASTSSTTTTSTTVAEPITSGVPPTDPDQVDVSAAAAAAFAAYEATWLTFREAVGDPSNDGLRQRVESLQIGDALVESVRVLDQLVADSLAEVTPGGRKSRIELITPPVVGGDNVIFQVCQILIDPVINVVSEEIVFDEITASTKNIQMEKVEGDWKLASEITAMRWDGPECE